MEQTLALDEISIALGRSNFDSIRDKLDQVSDRMHDVSRNDMSQRVLDKITPNTMLRLKPHYKDVIATKHLVEADATVFSKYCHRIAMVMAKSPYYCLSWWYQGLLAIAISAAEARVATGSTVADTDLANLEDAVDAVDHAYTKLLIKLRAIKGPSQPAVWSKLKRLMSRAVSYLRDILNKLSAALQKDAADPRGWTKLAIKSGVVALVTRLLQFTLGAFAAGIIQLMSIPVFNKIKVNQSDLLSDKLVSFIGRAAEGVKLYTRPDFAKTFYARSVDDSRLYGVIKQLEREVSAAKQHTDLGPALEAALRQCSARRIDVSNKSAEARTAAVDTAKAAGYYPYISPLGVMHLFSGNGNNKVLGQRLYEAFAREASKVVSRSTKVQVPEPKK